MTPWQYALLNTMTGPALVCTPNATVQAWNDEAAQMLMPDVRDADAVQEQLHGTLLTQWIDADAWQQLQEAASTEAPTVIVQLGDAPRRMQATRIAPQGTPHWLVRNTTPPAPRPDPSHDLLRRLIESMRTPLASIRAAVETMQQYPQMGADAAAQFTDVIAGQGIRLTELIDDASTAYTAMYRTRRALEPMGGAALLTWTQTAVQEGTDVPVSTSQSPSALTVHLDPAMLRQGFAFVSDRFVHATRCTALTICVQRSDSVALLDLCAADGQTVTEARVERWKDATIPWGTTMMQLTLHALLDQHDAQLWVEQTETGGSALRFAFPVVPANE
ncbi:hypothetical protein CRI93_06050 [Longimonas halophila]|uniref:histidine kinase n=1 Tax=Longimonas halophila TaxID=1469170 RepID=A0A2H3P6N9_9BACT|nr:hypothetical protein [Longimonas halophila]PEN08002.1 hypothetical protein CRI93_06050 [Longimonas halophila]